jgi:membrane-associated phospholipid phosphatase
MIGPITPPATATPRPTTAHRLARLVTETCAPGILVIVVLVAVGWHSTHNLIGVGWALGAAFFCGALPYAFVLWGVHRSRWTDRHITRREQRLVPLLVTLASVTAAVVLLAVMPGAPHELLALVVAMVAGLALTLAVTLWWKVSVHTAVAAGVCAVLTLTYGPILLLTAPVAFLTGWSRVTLEGHTRGQAVAGGALGALIATTVYTLLR